MMFNLIGGGQGLERKADVHIIGAGTVGLVLASKLSKAGLKVIVSESGGVHQSTETHPLNEVVQLGTVYSGASAGRFRCLGGTSTRWGGAMIPFLDADLEFTSCNWPIKMSDLKPYQTEVELLFELPFTSYEIPELLNIKNQSKKYNFIPRLAKWPPFSRRNTFNLFKSELSKSNSIEVWLNATATEFKVGCDGSLSQVRLQATDGSFMTVSANETILAAGAIESTRLLLLLDAQHNNQFFEPHRILGHYFYDHLSVQIGEIKVHNRTLFNQIFGFRFEGKCMRNLRFELCPTTPVRSHVRPGFVHISFDDGHKSFRAVKEFFRCIQRRKLPKAVTLFQLFLGLPWLIRVLWWRYFKHRLLYPDNVQIGAHLVLEQMPVYDNHIGLSNDKLDMFGMPLASIRWRVLPADLKNMEYFKALFLDYWSTSDLASLGKIIQRPVSELDFAFSQCAGIYHPGGSTKMGLTAADGVVNSNLQTFAIPNLSVASTSVFPSGCGANPTMMLLMMGCRLADRLIHKLA